MPLGMLVAMHCYFQNVDGSCQTLANAYVKYNKWDKIIQDEQDKFVREHQTMVAIGGAVALVANKKFTFVPIGGCIFSLDMSNPQNQGFSIGYNFGF